MDFSVNYTENRGVSLPSTCNLQHIEVVNCSANQESNTFRVCIPKGNTRGSRPMGNPGNGVVSRPGKEERPIGEGRNPIQLLSIKDPANIE